ncbi:KAP family P-loop NTPase fold protein, partial [Methyloglobulus morosus]|uniref:KAP family P-loop NTPase fold protein n=1 Tax=Methyloglobulus morosus TaxID=1410681 RepID=UPI00056CE4D7
MQKPREIEIDENDPFKEGVDLLNRKDEILNLTPIVLNYNDPLVLALDAPWGAGKTTFVKFWQAYLKKEGKQSICFNAWETDFSDDPLIVLVSELDKWVKASKNDPIITKWRKGIATALPGVAKRTVVAAVKASTFGALDISADLERTAAEFTGNIASDLLENFNKQAKSIQQFKALITEAISALPNDQKNLIIFIDELDRCRPTYAIELLERIKHLFSIERLVFVLSTDTMQLAHSIRAIYGNDFDGKKYLQRFIDLDYALKKPESEKYIE